MSTQIRSQQEMDHMVRVFKEKFISPYKIIYLIDQKEADYFKCRNKSTGCCSSSEVTIPESQCSKIEKVVAQLISYRSVSALLPEILDYCEDRYRNIADKGKNDKLKITTEVQKYLIDNIMSEVINHFVFQRAVTILAKQSNSINSGISLWATPQTWFAKYPGFRLQLFSSSNMNELFSNGYTIIEPQQLHPYIAGLTKELTLLEKDGRFQQILQTKDKSERESNEDKVIRNSYAIAFQQNSNNFKNLKSTLILLQSMPFQLNMKANQYLTISENILIFYCKSAPEAKLTDRKGYKFAVLTSPSTDLEVSIGQNASKLMKAGSILVNKEDVKIGYRAEKSNGGQFLIKNWIHQTQKKA